jgi:SNF2 family DNA or RNA helicase
MSPEIPYIELLQAGNTPHVVVERHRVSDDVWDEIALVIADVDQQPAPGRPIIVRPEALLRTRASLFGVLKRFGVDIRADETVTQMLRNAKADDRAVRAALDVTHPSTVAPMSRPVDLASGRKIIRELRPFQERDLLRLSVLPHGANFSVPGAGKTTVTYVLHCQLLAVKSVDRLLVIAPLSAFGAWQEDAAAVVDPALSVERWRSGPVPNSDVVLLNYQRLLGGVEKLTSWMSMHSVHLVVDEAHRAKRGATGGWGRALLALAPYAVRRDILTGTPAPNHPRDLVSLMDFLWPGGVASSNIPVTALKREPSLAAMKSVNSAIRPLYVRTTKEELGLPKVEIRPVKVRMGKLQKDIYDALLSRYAGLFDLDRRDSAMFAQMGEVTMYLLQAACSPRLLSSTADPGRTYRYPPLAIPPGSRLASLVDDYQDHEVAEKVAQACKIVRDNALLGRKTLVWSNFPDNLLDLEQQLRALYPALVYGSIPSADDARDGVRTREREIARFTKDQDCFVMLANPAAMAEGVSLHHACHDAVYLDRTFNAGQYLQSLDRIHRLGLAPDTETRVTLLISEKTIDERVDGRVANKTRLLSRMLADPALVQMALPDDDDYGAPVDHPDDLEEILRHLQDVEPARALDDE